MFVNKRKPKRLVMRRRMMLGSKRGCSCESRCLSALFDERKCMMVLTLKKDRVGSDLRGGGRRSCQHQYYNRVSLAQPCRAHCWAPGRFMIESMPMSTLGILETESMYGLGLWLWASCPPTWP